MLKIVQHCISNQRNNKFINAAFSRRRTFLSSAFELESEFNARLDNKVIKKVNPSNMYLELDQQYNRHKKLHAIDVDLYVNSVTNDVHTEELEDILYKYRLTPSTIDMLESTHHAFIRLYLKLNKVKDLLNILDDRLNYGVFPDEYCNNLLMNHFIKTNNFRDSAKIAAIQMLQEDFSNEITKYFSLYSCLKYLQAPTPWHDPTQEIEEKQEDEDEDEEVRVRVKYLRNPYYDGHFDLRGPNDLIGKTLITIGRTDRNDVMHQSYYLMGLGLMKNIPEAKLVLESIENGKTKVAKDSLVLFKKYVTSGDLGETVVAKESKPSEASTPANEEIEAILKLADKAMSSSADLNLLDVTEQKLKETVEKFEKQEIEKQKQIYIQWDTQREQILRNHLEKLKEAEIFEAIERKKQEIAKEEERLFFFDNENKIDLLLEEKYPPVPEVVVKKRNEFDGKRNLGRINVNKNKKKTIDPNYVPPDLHKPYN